MGSCRSPSPLSSYILFFVIRFLSPYPKRWGHRFKISLYLWKCRMVHSWHFRLFFLRLSFSFIFRCTFKRSFPWCFHNLSLGHPHWLILGMVSSTLFWRILVWYLARCMLYPVLFLFYCCLLLKAIPCETEALSGDWMVGPR